MREPRRPFNLAVTGAVLVGLALFASGCGSQWQNYEEGFLRAGIYNIETAPDWVRGDMSRVAKEHPGVIFFTGRGVGQNTLDERGAYDAARDHCLTQLAKQVATRVHARVVMRDDSQNLRFRPGEWVQQHLKHEVMSWTDALAGDLVDRSTYWEQWYLQEEPERIWPFSMLCSAPQSRDCNRIKRYKCWVLMSIDEDKMEARVARTAELLRIQAARPYALFSVTDVHTRSAGN